jgi:hypothetical protein
MYHGRYGYEDDDRRAAEAKRERQKQIEKDWGALRETERKLYSAVANAWRKNKLNGRWDKDMELSEWITREQIADELGTFRLIPYYIKLLDHLTGGKSSRDYNALHWIQKAKRTRWRRTWENRKRPAGYEWVYYPREDVLDALVTLEANKKREANEAVKALEAAPPKREINYDEINLLLKRSKAARIAIQSEPETLRGRLDKWIKDKLYW